MEKLLEAFELNDLEIPENFAQDMAWKFAMGAPEDVLRDIDHLYERGRRNKTKKLAAIAKTKRLESTAEWMEETEEADTEMTPSIRSIFDKAVRDQTNSQISSDFITSVGNELANAKEAVSQISVENIKVPEDGVIREMRAKEKKLLAMEVNLKFQEIYVNKLKEMEPAMETSMRSFQQMSEDKQNQLLRRLKANLGVDRDIFDKKLKELTAFETRSGINFAANEVLRQRNSQLAALAASSKKLSTLYDVLIELVQSDISRLRKGYVFRNAIKKVSEDFSENAKQLLIEVKKLSLDRIGNKKDAFHQGTPIWSSLAAMSGIDDPFVFKQDVAEKFEKLLSSRESQENEDREDILNAAEIIVTEFKRSTVPIIILEEELPSVKTERQLEELCQYF